VRSKTSSEEVDILKASTIENEKKVTKIIEENKGLQLKYNGIEKLHAETLKKLYDQISESEQKYALKVEEFTKLQEQYSEISINKT
jgi:hypothetical protein